MTCDFVETRPGDTCSEIDVAIEITRSHEITVE
jgi:hypothetical protein